MLGNSVIALHSGYVFNGGIYSGEYQIIVKDFESKYEIGYSHVDPNTATQGAMGRPINAGDEIGKLVEAEKDPTIFGGLAHLHLSLKVPPGSDNYVDPSFLIQQWGPEYDS